MNRTLPAAVRGLCVLALTLSCAAVPAPAAADAVPEPPAINARSYVLIDFETGQVLASKEPAMRVEPASITKVMTTYVAFDEMRKGHLKHDDTVLISERAWRQGKDSSESRMFLDLGSRVPLVDILRGIVIQSGNDASVALAEHLAGTEDAFATLMNAEAARLGMKDTHYTNAPGMPNPEHYTTAMDTAKLVQALIRDFPEHYAMYREKEFSYNSIPQYNRNLLLWRDATVDGVKTGHTSSAGYCLASSALREGRRLIAVVMGMESEEARAQASLALLNWGFRFFENANLYGAADPVQTVRIYKGETQELALGLGTPLAITIPRGSRSQVQVSAQIEQPVIAPVEQGQVLGTVTVTLNGKPLRSDRLVALQAVPEGGFFTRLADAVRLYFDN